MQTMDEFLAECKAKLASVKNGTGDLSQKGLDHMAFVLATMPKLVKIVEAYRKAFPASHQDMITLELTRILNGEADGTE